MTFLKEIPDIKLKEIINDRFDFVNAVVITEQKHIEYKALVSKICRYHRHSFSFAFADSFIVDEALSRWIKTVK